MTKSASILMATLLFTAACGSESTDDAADSGLDGSIGDGSASDGSAGDAIPNIDAAITALGCEGTRFEGTVEASPWANALGVNHYRYRGAIDEATVVVEAWADDLLMETRIVQVPEDGLSGLPHGAMHINFAGQGATGVLYTTAVETETGYVVASHQESDAFGVLRTESRFELTHCSPEATAVAPACGAPLDLTRPLVRLPACGVLADGSANDRMPQLAGLTYVADVEAAPAMGGIRHEVDSLTSTLTVFDGTTTLDDEAIEAWTTATGVRVDHPAQRTLNALYLDQAWRRRVAAHVDVCTAPDGVARNGLGVRRDALSPGTPGLDGSAQLASGLADAEKKVSKAIPIQGLKICIPGTGCSNGDPHFITFDGMAFDLQAAGEFTLIRGESFLVQARFEPPTGAPAHPGCGAVTFTTAAAFELHGIRWQVDMPELRIFANGEPVDLRAQGAMTEARIVFDEASKTLVFHWPTGEVVKISGYTIGVELPDGHYSGLLGTETGSLELGDGGPFAAPADLDALYTSFAESWRMAPGDSLFTYPEGGAPGDYDIPDFPSFDALAGFEPLREAEIGQMAAATCASRDIVDPVLLAACILDVACTGDPSFADATARVSPPMSVFPLSGPVIEGPARFAPEPDLGTASRTSACAEDGEALAWVFPEAANVTLDSDIDVQVASAGRFEGNSPSVGTLTGGTQIDSYGVHLSHLPDARLPRTFRIKFDRPVVGIITDQIVETDAELGGTVDYPPDRGLEWKRDAVELSADRRTVTLRMSGRERATSVRILVEAKDA